ncbi:PHP domain-containing protein [Biformimicrobium ophioploci]|nr:PHP domain-containing protein [Microbulbifer sp. NKW57]
MPFHGQVDLHCHSSCSDGILSPAALVSRAKANGVEVLALTDHDTCAGIAEAVAAGAGLGVEVIAGIEVSVAWGKRQLHVLGLGVDPEHPSMEALVQAQRRRREARAEIIAQRLEKRGFHGALAGARAQMEEGAEVLARPHFARWLVAAGHVDSATRAFKKLLGPGKIGDVKPDWPELAEVVELLHECGGLAVLAHPLKYGFTRTVLRRLLSAFEECGGDAVEVVCGQQTPVQTRDLAAMAVEAGLAGSIGSDFHTPGQPWAELGIARMPDGVEPVWNLWQNGRPIRPVR